jgi:hypothetical protein
MQTEAHPLELFFHQAVRSSLVDKLGMNDPEIVDYVTHVLCEFSEPENLYRLKNADGRKAETIPEMVKASDPVLGTAASFEEERSARKYIGDYALFMAGMHLDVMESAPHFETDRPMVDELIRVGKESYFVVSQFNVFDYAEEAPLFARLAESLDRCILGLALIREELRNGRMIRLK